MAKMRKTHSQKPISSLLFFLCILFLTAKSQKNQEDEEEQRILLELKQEFGNPSSLQSWNPSSNPLHCTNWSGITCNTNNSVTKISLFNMSITEKVPTFICDLKNLTEIDLSSNNIPGGFPVSVLNCSKLESLDLSLNYFVGVIPNVIDKVSSLKALNLGGNNFSGDIPSSIGNLELLESLSLWKNPFVPSKIPDEFSKLVKLKTFWMEEVNLVGEIPEWIVNFTTLDLLNLASNNLSGKIPKSLFSLKNLTYVKLFQNKLSGEIPKEIECLGMEGIDLSMNELTGSIPGGFGKWKNLTNLVMYWNQLTGEIPKSIGLLPLLTDIRLFGNDLTGELPEELGLHSKLLYLEVDGNRLSGKLPENLCFGGEFYGISAFSNSFTGELPKTFAECPSLTYVMLYKNMLGGEIPASFWLRVNLSYVQIHDNMFSGELPHKLSSSLQRLEIENNRFTGRIPLDIASSAQLVVFDGSNNLFTGKIPMGLTALSQLTSLALDGNEISGSIPFDIISWKSLNTLTLSRNRISGVLPQKIGSLPNLNKLDLSENQISGSIPFEIGNLKLSFLNLSSNLLTGKIPSQIEYLGLNSFLYNSGLCSNSKMLNLMSCDSLSGSRTSRKLSPKFIALIVVIGVVMILLAVIMVLVAIRSIHKRKEDDEEDSVTWKVIKFQRLVDFTESQILSGLTKSNLIGSGGCGEVYKVSINHPDKSVAVKKISSKGKLDSKHATQFQAEVEILGSIKHNNIVKLMGYMSSKYTKLLVYEYMENGSLDQWLHQRNNGVSNLNERRTLDWQKRLNIAVGVAQGLSYIHHNCSPPIIHRDVKSSNILLDSDFKAKVADFGLAKIVQSGSYSASIVAGSFGYIAPEYGRTLKVNEKVDVYSFGVILLELVTGREANKGDEDRSLAEWAADRFLKASVDVLLDEEVKEGCNLEEMTSVFKLGLMCTSALPSSRPSMSEALQYLVRQCSSQEIYEKKASVTADNDVAPLLLSSHSADFLSTYKGGRSKKRMSDVVHSAEEV